MKKKIKVCIIGYGSIGERHANILFKFKEVGKIYIITNRSISNKFIKIKKVSDLDDKIDYVIISNKTLQHYKTLTQLEKKIKNKKILVEKPIFSKFRKISSKNKIFVGYNMRFNPIIKKLKAIVKNKNIWSINLICSSFLPYWRKNRDYKKVYSSNKKEGGGVLLDLSHEIDYLQWIFGKIKIKDKIVSKISNLKISAEDYLSLIGTIGNNIKLNLEMSYLSRYPIRRIQIEGNNLSIEVDLIKKIILSNNNNKQIKIFSKNFDRNFSYKEMHKAIINNKVSDLCNLSQGLKTLKLIDRLKNE